MHNKRAWMGSSTRPTRRTGKLLPQAKFAVRSSNLEEAKLGQPRSNLFQSRSGSKNEFSGHSLRAGLATSAAEAGQNEREIMNQARYVRKDGAPLHQERLALPKERGGGIGLLAR